MKMKMILSLRPFDLAQQLYVYQDGNNLEFEKVPTKDVIDVTAAMLNKYDELNIVQLIGPEKYCFGFKEKLLTKYTNKPIEIII